MSHLEDDQILAQWNKMSAQVLQTASRAATDPAYAAALDLAPKTLRESVEPEQAGWLRACAEKMIPSAWEWEIMSMIGGQCMLMLKRYRPEQPPGLGA